LKENFIYISFFKNTTNLEENKFKFVKQALMEFVQCWQKDGTVHHSAIVENLLTRGPILENHGMPLSLQISFFLYRKWHAIIFKNRAPELLKAQNAI
jgi:hypothetical protein